MNKRTLEKIRRELKEAEDSLNIKEFILKCFAKDLNLKIERFHFDYGKCTQLLINEDDEEVEIDDININSYIYLFEKTYEQWYKIWSKLNFEI